MTNARKAKARKEAIVAIPTFEPQLRVLSPRQRKMMREITKDWKRFTGGMFSDMYDKI